MKNKWYDYPFAVFATLYLTIRCGVNGAHEIVQQGQALLEKKRKEKNMKPINLNALAVEVSEVEGKKKETDIAQIKEVIRATFDALAQHGDAEILEAVRRST